MGQGDRGTDELKEEVLQGRRVDIEAELGDLFFSLINAAQTV